MSVVKVAIANANIVIVIRIHKSNVPADLRSAGIEYKDL